MPKKSEIGVPEKIIELNPEDWMKGISFQGNAQVGGLYQSYSTDPFYKMGLFVGAKTPTSFPSVTTQINALLPLTDGVNSYVFGLGQTSNYGTSPIFYRFNLPGNTTTDKSSSVFTSTSPGASLTGDAMAYYESKLIYAGSGDIRKVGVNFTGDADIGSYSGRLTNFSLGPLNRLYFGLNSAVVGYIDLSFTLVGSAYTLDSSYTVKQVGFDGDYLVILADNNPGSGNASIPNVKSKCLLIFWDGTSTVADKIYVFEDDYVTAMAQLGNDFIIFGSQNIWSGNFWTRPMPVFSFRTNSNITTTAGGPNFVTTSNNSVLWTNNIATGKVYGYGNPIPGQARIAFQPFAPTQSTDKPTALTSSHSNLYVATDSPKAAYSDATGSATFQTTNITFHQPYMPHHMKVILGAPLASGQSFTIGLTGQSGSVPISDNTTISYSATNAKQTFIINTVPSASGVQIFEDAVLTATVNGGAEIQRVEVWGVPQDPFSQGI